MQHAISSLARACPGRTIARAGVGGVYLFLACLYGPVAAYAGGIASTQSAVDQPGTPAFEQRLAPSPALTKLAQKLAPTRWVYLESLELPADAKYLNVATQVSKSTLDDGLKWIRLIISPPLIPKDPETAIAARPQVLRWVFRDDDGKPPTKLIGDYFVLESDVSGQPSRIHENGNSVTITTRLPTTMALKNSDAAQALVISQLPILLNFPRETIPRLRFEIHEQDGFYYGRATTWEKEPDGNPIVFRTIGGYASRFTVPRK